MDNNFLYFIPFIFICVGIGYLYIFLISMNIYGIHGYLQKKKLIFNNIF